MRYRPAVAIALTAALAATLPAHAGGMKTLDGKKTKALTFSLKSAPQENDTSLVGDLAGEVGQSTPFDRPADYAHCPKSRCLTYAFRYKPAKGVKPGPFSVKISWTIPGQDYDLYVIVDGGDAGHCGASAGSSEVVVVPAIKGKVYKVVVDEYRAAPDTITGTVTFPAKDGPGDSPAGDPGGVPVSCGM